MDLPKEGKLVRDRIPDVMRSAGAQPRVTALSPDQILPALLSKLNEEVDEFLGESPLSTVGRRQQGCCCRRSVTALHRHVVSAQIFHPKERQFVGRFGRLVQLFEKEHIADDTFPSLAMDI